MIPSLNPRKADNPHCCSLHMGFLFQVPLQKYKTIQYKIRTNHEKTVNVDKQSEQLDKQLKTIIV